VAIVLLASIFRLSRRDPVNADNVVLPEEVGAPAPDYAVRAEVAA
jgi:hypothetical protein